MASWLRYSYSGSLFPATLLKIFGITFHFSVRRLVGAYPMFSVFVLVIRRQDWVYL